MKRRSVLILVLVASAVLIGRELLPGDRVRDMRSPPSPASIGSEVIVAELVRVLDGDSLIVREDSDDSVGQIEVRIHGIDAPERRQPFSQVSRRELDRALRGSEIRLVPLTRDRYDRVVAKLIVDGRDVGLGLIEAGLAWHYRRYADEQSAEDRELYRSAEERAREERRGLWEQPRPVAPWEYRRNR